MILQTASASAERDGIPLPWNPARRPARISTDPLDGLKPRLYQVKGRPTPFYGIGDLAKILGRKPDTIRGWEEMGWLPRPTAVFPGRDPRNAYSAKHGRRRLYTRAQLLGIYKIAHEEGILEKHARPITQTNFAARVKKLFEDLAARELAEDARRNAAGSAL